jgi:hypothetical protein
MLDGGRFQLPVFDAEQITADVLKPNRPLEFLRPPFRKFEISIAMSAAHAARILEEIVEPPRVWGRRSSAKRGFFEGKVVGTRFKFHRVIRGQNSFVPIVEGSFRPKGLGSVMTLNMRLVWPVMVFWIGVVMFLAWSSIEVDSSLGPFRVRMVVAAMALFMYLLATVCFAVEVRIALKRLLELARPQSEG